MIKLSKQQINSIAQDLDAGRKCYVHKTTGVIISIPSKPDELDENFEKRKVELKEVELNPNQYILVAEMPTSDTFRIMRRFLGKVSNPKIRGKLIIAISQNKPFRDILDYNGDVLQDWYDFKQEAIEKYVNKFFDTFDKE